MRAKKIIAPILSLALCTGNVTAAYAASESTQLQGSISSAAVGETAAQSNAAVSAENTATVITIKLGDINNDGMIDAADASSVLAAYAKLSIGLASGFTPTQTVASDINKDNRTDAVDASGILSYYAYVSTLSDTPLSIESFLKKRSEPITTTATAPVTTVTTTTATTASTTSAASSTSAAAPTTTSTVTAVTTSTATASSAASTTTTTTTATASVSETTAAATTTADPKKVTGLKLSKTEINLNVGEGDISIVTMLPATSDKREKWTTSDPNVAAVNYEGWITAISEGVCTVTVQSVNNPEIKAEIKVTVTDPGKATDIKLSKTEISINTGTSDIAAARISPTTADKAMKWTSSDEIIATVDNAGRITGISEGVCTVTVQSVRNPEVKADITVTVIDPNRVREIKLSKTEMIIPAGTGDISMVTMLPDNASNKNELWISSDENVAVVRADGWITGVSAGTCTVTVISKSNPDVKAEIKVRVTDPRQPIGISLSKYEMDILTDTMDVSIVSTLPKSAAAITEVWTSSDPGIAYVDQWGNVYGKSAGTCTVTVSSREYPDIRADIKVTVHSRPVITTTTAATTATSSTTAATSTTSAAATSSALTETTEPAVTTHLIQSLNGATYVDGILIVNKTYSIDKDFPADGLTASTAENFRLLSEDAAKLGLNIVCSSGFRSYEYQEQLYNNYAAANGEAVADTFSARAGHSEHQTGLAIDVNSISDDFAGTPECEWLAQNAHKYGFIIRYPKGKEAYTGFKYEPWHIRFLGTETATKVYESGLSLEEYLGIGSSYK